MESERLPILPTVLRLLTFQAGRHEMQHLDKRYLAFGLLCTWFVGMGRSWDDAQAGVLQHLGIGSIVYVFALSLLLWLTIRPFVNDGYSYLQMVTFVSLVSPPGLLYAIPVEQLFTEDVARSINMLFLSIVATWRVALLIFYFRKGLALEWSEVAISALLPLSTIMAPITIYRALESIATSMGGLRGGTAGANQLETVLDILGGISILAFLPLVSLYMMMVARR